MKPESAQNDGRDRLQHEVLKDEFRQASNTIWDSQVRTALIFSKELFACKGCLSFFSREDGQHDHPADQTYLVTKLCVTKNITSEQSFFLALWAEAIALLAVHGVILTPGFRTKHIQPPAVKPEAKKEQPNQCLQSRVFSLEVEVASLKERVKQLTGENHLMKRENDSLLEQVLGMKRGEETIQWRARKHLDALQGLLTPDYAPDVEGTDIVK